MKTKHYLTLDDAEILVDTAIKYAQEHQFKVSISIVDDAGALLLMKRMDGASALTAGLSLEKAKASALSRRPTKAFEDLIRNGQMGFLTVDTFKGQLEGGEPILYLNDLVGAIGISGVKSYQDAEIAQYAIAQLLAQIES